MKKKILFTLNEKNLEEILDGQTERNLYIKDLNRESFPNGNFELLTSSKGGSLASKGKSMTGLRFLKNESLDPGSEMPFNMFVIKTEDKIKAYFKVISEDDGKDYELMSFHALRSPLNIKVDLSIAISSRKAIFNHIQDLNKAIELTA